MPKSTKPRPSTLLPTHDLEEQLIEDDGTSVLIGGEAVRVALPDMVSPVEGEVPTKLPWNPLKRMKPKHHTVLTLLLQGHSQKSIAKVTGYTWQRIQQICQSPVFKAHRDRVLQARYEAVIQGEHGPIAMAQAESTHLMKGLLRIAKIGRSENTRRMAIMDALAIAGYQPVTKTESLSLDKLFDDMSPVELDRYAKTGRMPLRTAALLRAAGRSDIPVDSDTDPLDITPGPTDPVAGVDPDDSPDDGDGDLDVDDGPPEAVDPDDDPEDEAP